MPLEKRRADDRGVIGLDRENACRRFDKGLVGKKRGRALVGGDADVLEDEGAEQEIFVAGIRVERFARTDQAGGPGRGRKGAVGVGSNVDGRLGDGGCAQCLAQEFDMGPLIERDFLGILGDLGDR